MAVKAKTYPPSNLPKRHKSPNQDSIVSKNVTHPPSFQQRLKSPNHAKTCYFYKDGDYKFSGVKIAVNPRRYRRLEALYAELNSKINGLPYGVRSIFTPHGRNVVRSIEGLEDDGQYICSTFRHHAEGLDVTRVAPPAKWNYNKPSSGQRDLNSLLHEDDHDDPPRVKQAHYVREQRMANYYNRSQPKKITVLRNGDPTQRHILLINRRTAQTFDQILTDLSDMFSAATSRLFTMEGRRVNGLTQLFNGPDVLVAAGKEPFRSMLGVVFEPQPPPGQGRHNARGRLGTGDYAANKIKERRDRMFRSKGQWRVWVTTSELATAGTTAQVMLTVYGHKGNTPPFPLGFGDGQHFQSGHIDEFDINVGSIGEIYKIRIAHDNTGSFPGWLCDEVRMQDRDTGEELVFPVKRWLAREEDDHEICRELPVSRHGDPQLPVIKYEIIVVTGDLWNAGTDANVYMTLYGDRGDSGVRQLFSSSKDKVFRKGQTDHFTLEAVSLGKLKRIIVGHDGTGPGDGWFLEKILVQETGGKPQDVTSFYCGKWLDEGEDDGKIVRELKVQDEYMDDILAKRNWEFEKWKFESKNQVMFFSVLTGKALRVKIDGTVDGLGEKSDPGAEFTVSSKKPMVRVFTSMLNGNFHLGIDNGKVIGHGKGGPYCEFRIHVQSDCTVMLEGVKSPLQFVSLLESGKVGDPRGVLDHDPGKRFFVYCKGIVRHRGIVMLRTSSTQAISVDHDFSVFGTGKCTRSAHFRVHKLDSNGVRLFESVIHPGKYLRLHEGKIDCQGGREEKSQFVIEKHRDKGYITLQSRQQRGIFLGLTSKGEVRPTVDTGVNNICLFPEVIEFGVSKQHLSADMLGSVSEKDTTHDSLIHTGRSVEPKNKQTEISDGDFEVTVSSLESLEHGDAAIIVYGDKGNTGPIILTPSKPGTAFRAGSVDDFKINAKKAGQIYKIRLELVAHNVSRSPTWKVGQLKMLDLNSRNELTFNFNRWLSRHEDDGEIMREMPVSSKGKEVLPVRKYQIHVCTGKEEGADTTATVYLNLFGEHGDLGKRFLLKSNNRMLFQRGQVDVFEMEAVSLGTLSQCLIGHDGTRAGDGWHLDSVTVYDGKTGGKEYVFPCNKWLDSGKEDRKIERILPVKEINSRPSSGRKSEEVHESKDKANDGDWKLLITTGKDDDMECADAVVLYAYGSKGMVGPIPIGNGDDFVFQPGNTNEFKIHIDPKKTGKLYKLRIGLTEQVYGAQWFLDKMTMVNAVSGNTLNFNVKRWLSRQHDDYDVWRELPVIHPEEKGLPVLKYHLLVHTGEIDGADTDADIFVTMFGERGDSGRRRLYKSKSGGKPFRQNKVDEFVLEAVTLGKLLKLVVGHDEKNAGDGWYLGDITVAESDESNAPQVFFQCNRWLDAGKDDHKTEVELFPGEKKQKSGEYKLWVRTASDSSPANGGKVLIDVYGSKGHRKDIQLFAPNKQSHLFEAGNIDEFEVATGDIGEIYKLRINREDTPSWKAWHLEEVKLQDEETGQILVFNFDRWFSREMDDHDLVRELPALKDHKPVLQGDHWAAETDATVFITLTGTKGDSGKRTLYIPPNVTSAFRRGNEDVFELEAVDLGDLQSIVVGHNGNGHGSGWFLDKVVVKQKSVDGSRFVFPCFRWLDSGEDDGRTERELRHIDIPDFLHISPIKKQNHNGGEWQIYVKTSDLPDAATCAQVYLTVYGSKGVSQPLQLGDGSLNSDLFRQGKESQFQVTVGEIGEITKIRLEHDNRNPEPSWHVDYVRMIDKVTKEEIVFPLNRWLAGDKDDGQLHRECSVMSPSVTPLPVLHYIIAVQTGRQRSAGAIEGSISINLIGSHGDTGQQLLQHPLTNPRDKMTAGKLDVYSLEAVSVGTLKSVRVVFEGMGKVKKWFLKRVMVMESLGALEEAVFDFSCWLNINKENAKEVPLTGMQFASSLTDDIIYRILGHHVLESQGRWDVTVWTGGIGTKEPVLMVLYGTTGHTDPKHINKKAAINPGSLVHFQVDAGNIGPLFKIRLQFGDQNSNSSWFLEKLKLKDLDTGQEFNFDYNSKVVSTPNNPDGAIELPVIRPDLMPLQETTYLISVSTGTQLRAETEAEISCTLIGQWGDSGQKNLSNSKSNKTPFQKGQTDQFEVKTLYLGQLSKIMIGHNESGRGCGWFCQQITVQELGTSAPDKLPEVIFVCNRWFDSGCDDRRLMRELLPTGYVLPTDVAIDRSASHGVWKCSVKMASEDKLDASLKAVTLPEEVFITVFGTHKTVGPIQLGGSNPDQFLLGNTDHFENIHLKDIGEIVKVKVGAGHEDDDNPIWMIDQMLLEDVNSKEVLRFDFSSWVGVANGDSQHELPVLRPGKLSSALVKYVVTVETANIDDAGTKSNVFIILHGQNGNSGQRRLLKSSSYKTPFQKGQTDVFTVEAVDLGDINKVMLVKGPGDPWYLNEIKVKAGHYAPVIKHFLWKKWIGDQSQHSDKVDVTIPVTSTWPSQVALPPSNTRDMPESGGHWLVEIVTGEQGSTGNISDLVFVMCGYQGESAILPYHSRRERPFQPGQTDSSEISLAEDVGELFKVRVGFADTSQHKSLHIAKIRFEDMDTKDNFSYDFNNNVHINEQHDGWREFPVVWPAVHILPVVIYKIAVHTGDASDAGTDGSVYVMLHGHMGTTGRRELKNSTTNTKPFQPKQVDEFEIEAVSLLTVDKIDIGHDRVVKGEGWYLKRVVVTHDGEEDYSFECHRWLDGGKDDGRIERQLHLLEKSGAHSPNPQAMPSARSDRFQSPVQPKEKAYKWKVWTTTGSQTGQGSRTPIVVVLYGDKGRSDSMIIGNNEDETFGFLEGITQEFEIETNVDIGKLYKLRVGFSGGGQETSWYSDFTKAPSWYLSKIKLQDIQNERQYSVNTKQWLRIDETQDHWREFAVMSDDIKSSLPTHSYYVEVFTGDKVGAGTNANVFLEIHGVRGDTGFRHLHGSKTSSNTFERNAHDVFLIEAIDLGKLSKVKVMHDGHGVGAGWFLDRITVKESEDGKEKYVFSCEKWLDEGKDGGELERELFLTGVLREELEPPNTGDMWQVTIITSAEDGSGTDSNVFLTVFGNNGNSGPIPLGSGQGGYFQTGAEDHFKIRLDPQQIGKINKIRLEHDNTGLEPSWHVQKVVMTNDVTKENLQFLINSRLSHDDKYGDIVFEVPAQHPGEKPLSKYKYHVKMVTDAEPGSGTSAHVHINLVGSNGDSGRRVLRHNDEEHNKFQAGQTDSFIVEAVDLGQLEKVIVGLDDEGIRSSWKLQCVIIRVSEKESFVFPWGKWFNKEIKEAEILLAEVTDENKEDEDNDENRFAEATDDNRFAEVTDDNREDEGTDDNKD